MSLLEALRIALGALAANKMRSALTTLGVIIGVASVIAMVALGEGARRDIQERIGKLGSNLLFIAPGQADKGRIYRGFGSAQTLTVEESIALRHTVPEIAGVAPEITKNAQIKYGTKNGDFTVVGTFADFSFVRNVTMQAGRFFTGLDDQSRRRVAVIGSSVYDTLFEDGWAIGKRIKIRGIPFTIVGVLEPRGGRSRDDEVIVIPMSTFRQRMDSTKYVRLIALSGKEGVELEAVQEAAHKELRRMHKLRAGEEDDFTIATQADILSTMEESSKIFTMLLAGIASISLIVGGIGIMNIMLVTVTERTREIGIRKALGARQRDIRLQFLIESMVLSVFGGLMGITLGVLMAHITRVKFGLSSVVSTESVVLAFCCAAGIGIFFGYYPASQAGKLDPIEALRYE